MYIVIVECNVGSVRVRRLPCYGTARPEQLRAFAERKVGRRGRVVCFVVAVVVVDVFGVLLLVVGVHKKL